MDEPIIQSNASTNPVPPVDPSTQSVSLEVENTNNLPDEELQEDLSALSPLNVLKKRDFGGQTNQAAALVPPPPPPLVPPPPPPLVPPPPPPLLSPQTPQAPTPVSPPLDSTFVIPPRSVLENKIYSNESQVPSPPPPQTFAPAPIAPTPPQASSAPMPAPAPVSPSAPIAAPAPILAPPLLVNNMITNPVPVTSTVMPGLEQSAPSSKPARKIGLYAVLGLLLVIAIIYVTAYALASSGSRVPYFYTKLSGIKADGIEASQNALTLVKAKKNYLQSGELLMKLKDGEALATPSPTPEADSAGSALLNDQLTTSQGALTGFLTKINGKYDGVFWNTQDNSIQAAGSLNTDSVNQDIAFVLNVQAGQSWQVYLPSAVSDGRAMSVKEADMRQNILFNIFRPIPVTTLLDSAKKELTYQKATSDGKEVSAYTYTVDSSKLANWLPDGAVLDSASSLEVDYLWGSALPARVVFSGKIKYQGLTYDFSGDYKYADYGKDLADPLKTKMDPLNSLVKQSGLASTDVDAFISAFGIDPVNLPKSSVNNQTLGTDVNPITQPSPGVVPTAATTSSPTASATPKTSASPTTSPISYPTSSATASPTPTPSTAIIPSGESISQVEADLSTAPVIPNQTVSDAAKLRDTQRKKDLSDLTDALNSYKSDHGVFPAVSGTVQTISSQTLFSALVPKYLSKMPVDPLAHTYWYGYSSDGTTFKLTSVAEDYTDAGATKGQAYSYYFVHN